MPPSVKILASLAFCVVGACASVVYDTSASFTGTRSVGGSGGLIDGGGHGYDDLMVSWSIVSLPNWTYSYTYTITIGNQEAPVVSRAIVDLSNDCSIPASPNYSKAPCDSNPSVNGAPGVAIPGDWCAGGACAANSIPGLPNPIAGLEFVGLPRNGRTLTISFDALGPPVWGDFYIGGGLQYAYNIGNANHLTTNSLDFVAVPGAPPATAPEPKTLGLAGAALVLLGLLGKQRPK